MSTTHIWSVEEKKNNRSREHYLCGLRQRKEHWQFKVKLLIFSKNEWKYTFRGVGGSLFKY